MVDRFTGDNRFRVSGGGYSPFTLVCWVNPDHAVGSIKADYEIEALYQLEALLENL